jgi:ketosteroid isomerase-like protein
MSRENVEIARRWWGAFNEDGAAPLGLCHEEVEIRNPSEFPTTGPYFGHDGVRHWETDAWEVIRDLRMDVDELIDVGDGERVISVQTVRGRMRHSDLPADVQWAAVMTIRAGKLVRAQGYLTRAQALNAVGLRE